MGHCRPYADRARHGRFGYGYRQPQAAGGSDLPFRPRSAVHLRRFRSVLQEEWYQTFPGKDRYLLRQCRIGIDLRDDKKELIHTRPWPTMADLKRETDDWIKNYFNTKRRHSTLGYLTPTEYELGYRDISQLAA